MSGDPITAVGNGRFESERLRLVERHGDVTDRAPLRRLAPGPSRRNAMRERRLAAMMAAAATPKRRLWRPSAPALTPGRQRRTSVVRHSGSLRRPFADSRGAPCILCASPCRGAEQAARKRHRASRGTSYSSLVIERMTVTLRMLEFGLRQRGPRRGRGQRDFARVEIALGHSRLRRDGHFRRLPQDQRQLADIGGEQNLERLLLGHLEGHRPGHLWVILARIGNLIDCEHLDVLQDHIGDRARAVVGAGQGDIDIVARRDEPRHAAHVVDRRP